MKLARPIGVSGSVQALPSDRDQNVVIETEAGERQEGQLEQIGLDKMRARQMMKPLMGNVDGLGNIDADTQAIDYNTSLTYIIVPNF